jgi:hypothetical protein
MVEEYIAEGAKCGGGAGRIVEGQIIYGQMVEGQMV